MTKIEGSGSASGSISQRHESADPDPDPDPHQYVVDPQHWIRDCLILFDKDTVPYLPAYYIKATEANNYITICA